MAEFSKLIITNKGNELIAKAVAGIADINFTYVAASSRKYDVSELSKLVVLEDIEQTSLISKKEITIDGAVKVDVVFNNTELTKEYCLRAIGLYASYEGEELLYAVAIEKSGNYNIQAYNGVTVYSLELSLITSVGSSENVNLEVNPAGFATMEYVQSMIDTINIEVDSKLDSTSKNAIQNCVVTEKFLELENMTNSNFNKLNYNQYLSDIKSFGEKSYTMRKGNRHLFLELINNSLTVFGDDTIHDIIYNSLTADEIDKWLISCSNLGKALNLWYDTDIFPVGNIETIMRAGITTEMTAKLETKLRESIERYIEKPFIVETGLGKWLNDTYNLNVPELNTCENIADVANSQSGMTAIAKSEPAMVAVLASVTARMTVVANTTAMTAIVSQIVGMTIVAGNTVALEQIIDNTEIRAIIIGSSIAMKVIASSSTALNQMLANTTVAQEIIDSTTAITAIANDTVGMTCICNNATARTALINNSTANDIVINSVLAIGVVASNTTMFSGLLNNAATKTKIINNETAINVIANNSTGAATLCNNKTAFTELYASANFEIFTDSYVGLSSISKSSSAISIIVNNTSLIDKLINEGYADNFITVAGVLSIVANNSSAITKCLNNSSFISKARDSKSALRTLGATSISRQIIENSQSICNELAKSRYTAELSDTAYWHDSYYSQYVSITPFDGSFSYNTPDPPVLLLSFTQEVDSYNSSIISSITIPYDSNMNDTDKRVNLVNNKGNINLFGKSVETTEDDDSYSSYGMRCEFTMASSNDYHNIKYKIKYIKLWD